MNTRIQVYRDQDLLDVEARQDDQGRIWLDADQLGPQLAPYFIAQRSHSIFVLLSPTELQACLAGAVTMLTAGGEGAQAMGDDFTAELEDIRQRAAGLLLAAQKASEHPRADEDSPEVSVFLAHQLGETYVGPISLEALAVEPEEETVPYLGRLKDDRFVLKTPGTLPEHLTAAELMLDSARTLPEVAAIVEPWGRAVGAVRECLKGLGVKEKG